MSNTFDVFIFAGEKSGDLYGGKLLKALLSLNPGLKVYGVGGEQMRKEPFTCLLPTEQFQVMGFIDVFFALPKLFKQFRQVLKMILDHQPPMVVLIDYPGFNLRLAKALRKKGYMGKIFQYICPSVWAWGKKRIPFMATYYSRLLSILPFEASYFEHTHLPVEFIGHPLVSSLEEHRFQAINIPQGKRLIAIFPGSRLKELKRNLPLLLQVAYRLHQLYPDLHFALSYSQSCFLPFLHDHLLRSGLQEHTTITLLGADRSYDLMKQSVLALAKSGTVTLELALLQVPTVVVYAISKLDLFIVKYLLRIRLPYYALPNIIGNQEIFPELFGPNFTEETLLEKATHFLNDDLAYARCKEQCRDILSRLGQRDASHEAALSILNHL
ncbi:MAG: lipid-A-disaccharide synthase [Simkania sp.]|nr:lipid-A-disaccharide synthase [Simkania sp.]